jgi:hypothetical protein
MAIETAEVEAISFFNLCVCSLYSTRSFLLVNSPFKTGE